MYGPMLLSGLFKNRNKYDYSEVHIQSHTTHVKISKSNKCNCTESELLFSISETKMISNLVKQSNHKPMSKS